MKPVYSIVVPIYNEEENIQELYRRLKLVSGDLDGDAEFLLVDDGSKDRSLATMREISRRDPNVRYISLARNFGHQVAITAGLHLTRGEAVIVMDADLQHPPELVGKLIKRWRDGFDVVYAERATRPYESRLKRTLAFLYYRLLRVLTDVDIPADTGDFCLMDRKVVDVLNSLPERGRYLRGLRVWVGFPQTSVLFDQDARFAGDAKYTFRKSLSLGVNGIISFSRMPLRIASYLGLLAAFFALVMIVLVVYWRIFVQPEPLMGYATITAAIFFFGAVQLMCLGILGEYLGRVYEEVKGRPIYTVKEIGGAGESDNSSKRSRMADDAND